MDSLIQRIFVFLFILGIGIENLSSQTVSPPKVTSPISYCLGASASPLTATGSNLLWESPVASSVGPAMSANIIWCGEGNKTFFTTSVPNVKLISVDINVPSYQSFGSNLKYSLYDNNGNVLKTVNSEDVTAVNTGNRATITFNYLLPSAGTYAVAISAGNGVNAYQDNYSLITSTLMNITGTSSGTRAFSNIQYSGTLSSSVAPTPVTTVGGTYNYYVSQTVNGIKSNTSTISVIVNSIASPDLSSSYSFCQGTSVSSSTFSTSTLLWESIIRPVISNGSIPKSNFYVSSTNDRGKKVYFKTYLPGVTLTSLDYYLSPYSSVSDLRLGIYDGDGALLAQSSTLTSQTSAADAIKITNIFNYTIDKAGTYGIGIVSGTGHFGDIASSNVLPLSEISGTVSLTSTSFSSLCFDNLKFVVKNEALPASSVPYTNLGGSYEYYVSKVDGNCKSSPVIVGVNINGITSVTPGTACSNAKATLKATATSGYSVTWWDSATGGNQVGSGTTWETPALTSSDKTYYAQASINGKNSCTTTRTPVLASLGGIKWTGASDGASGTTSNWSTCNGSAVPNGTTDVIIPLTSNSLTLNADLQVRNLVLENNVKIYLNDKKLTVSSISGPGVIVGSPKSVLEITGTTNVNLRFDQTTPGSTNSLSKLIVGGATAARDIILENELILFGNLQIGANSELISDGNLTLKATATTNANIGPLLNGAQVSGNVHVQAFLTGSSISNRNFRTLTSPVYTASSPSKGYKVAGYKSTMYVTGPGGEVNGFDASPTNGSTIKYYNEPQKNSQNQYLYPANATIEVIPQGKGIYFYFRGKKDNSKGNKFVKVGGSYGTPEDVIMDYYGIINSGSISPSITYTNNAGEAGSNGFNLIGNPYPSVIDWESSGITKDGLETTIWIQKQNGLFAVYTPSVSNNGGSRFILPGQGFFVKANKANPSITFSESAKVPDVAPPTRLMSILDAPLISFSNEKGSSMKTNSSSINKVSIALTKDEYSTDETTIVVKDGSLPTLDESDISYMGEGPVTLTSVTPDSKYLAINYLPKISEQQEIPLYATATESGNYSLKLSDQKGMDATTVFLKDNYNGTVTNLNTDQQYSFDIDKTIGSTYGDRFKLMFIPATTLPIKLTTFTGKAVPGGVILQWATSSELNSKYYEIQQSANGKEFYTVGKIEAAGNSSTTRNYTTTDKSPIAGVNYYRLKSIDIDGLYTYSNVISADFSLISPVALNIYPNPSSEVFKIETVESKADLRLRLFDLNGKEIIQAAGRELVASSIDKGMYILEVRTAEDTLIGNYKVLKN
ncbi:T9SS type A sorting domain-containing protein [Desertivirga arenae]|uniref:Ig-like domain-containing protein n=1 Tax=Desertivirga arenae TaxID=2810309 RepID=UPI001A96BB1D|nr:T9SS type A sorting domain-containing protein [Pedobacter sp. SYSU D00823]